LFLHSSPSPLVSAFVAESADFASISHRPIQLIFNVMNSAPNFTSEYLPSLFTAMGKHLGGMRIRDFASWEDFMKAVERVRPVLILQDITPVSLRAACAWNKLRFVEQAAVRPETLGRWPRVHLTLHQPYLLQKTLSTHRSC
jgi:hypothetical protein